MNMQQIQNSYKSVQHTIGKYWLWLSLGILLFVAALAVNDANRTTVTLPVTGSSAQAQTVPDAAAQGVADYLRAHSSPSAQAVPDAAVQSVADYLQLHSSPSAQAVPEAEVQSVADYLRLHSNDLNTAVITDPAAKSVMDYLRAHGYEVP